MVTALRQATILTLMPALSQSLQYARPAGACLARAEWILSNKSPASIFRFVGNHAQELSPSGIVNTFSEHPSRQAFDIQIFNCDNSEVINQPATNLVMKVSTLIGDVLMNLAKQDHSFATTVRAFLSTSYFALSASQFRLRFSIPARVRNLRAVAQSGERK